ncbi:hypothetical protein [Brevundimonas naejangsanensis]|uniref:hypothetical protein n=1 Tax=Brevundimonas naejangsanensis TaxID=588932 RepID=UPI0039F69C39
MTVLNFEEILRSREEASVRLSQPTLKNGDGDGTSGGMDSRVTKLETQMEFVRDDLREIKGDLKTIIGRLGELPTKRDLTANTLTIVVIGLAVLAITIGGIVGGLAWIDRSGAPPPTAVASQ